MKLSTKCLLAIAMLCSTTIVTVVVVSRSGGEVSCQYKH